MPPIPPNEYLKEEQRLQREGRGYKSAKEREENNLYANAQKKIE